MTPAALGVFTKELITSIEGHKGSAVKVRSPNPNVQKISVTIPDGNNGKSTMILELYGNRDVAPQVTDLAMKLGFPVRLTKSTANALGLTMAQQHILVAD
ncbi:MAG: hypothetical protein WC464_06775 [Bdellovibrionales bacterium]